MAAVPIPSPITYSYSHTVPFHYIIKSFSEYCSSYPHGGYTSLGLFLTCAAALSTTTYAVASCRMLVVTFTSMQGGFEQTFSDFNDRDGTTTERYKVGAGLFQWLHPFDNTANGDSGSWSDGYCVGYQTTMLNSISDTAFETARGFSVFAVLLACIVTAWSLLMSCITWNRIQIRLLNVCLAMGAICTGLTFILKKAAICQTAFQDRTCSIDQGGLMLVAAVILWMAAFFISIIFLKPDDTDDDDENPVPMPRKSSSFENANRQSAKQSLSAKQFAQQRQKASQQRQKARGQSRTTASTGQTPPLTPGTRGSFDYSYDSRESWTNPVPSRTRRPAAAQLTVDDVSDQQELEVYMADRLDRIEGAMNDDDRSLRMEI
jgi:hypothetical protein